MCVISEMMHTFNHTGMDFSEGGKYLALAERRDCKDLISVFECASWHLVKVSTWRDGATGLLSVAPMSLFLYLSTNRKICNFHQFSKIPKPKYVS